MIYSPTQLANHLKLQRIKQNLTQQDVASKIGIKQSTLSNFENNPDKAQLVTFFKILQALELGVELMTNSPSPSTVLVDDEDW